MFANHFIGKKILHSTLAAVLLIAFTSCSSDDSNDTVEVPAASTTVRASVNGTEWIGNATSATVIRIASSNQQRFDITAENGSNRMTLSCEASLTNNETIPVGTYNFTSDPTESNALFTFAYFVGGNSFMEHFPEQGTLTITAVDAANKRISGTFSFNGNKVGILQETIVTPETIAITNGSFTNLSYRLMNL